MLARNATVDFTMVLDRSSIVKALEETLQNTDMDLHNKNIYVQRMLDRGVRKGEGRNSVLAGHFRRCFNQHLTGTISSQTLKVLLKRAEEYAWDCPECNQSGS